MNSEGPVPPQTARNTCQLFVVPVEQPRLPQGEIWYRLPKTRWEYRQMSRIEKTGTKDDAGSAAQDAPCSEHPSHHKKSALGPKLVVGVVALVLLIVGYFVLHHFGYLDILTSEQRLQKNVASLGAWGILVLIASMAVAIVMSPIPSGPIAMVAGAVFGPLWGGIYTVIGAVLGAAIAFGLARWLGYDFVCRWLEQRLSYLMQKRSQNRLMGIVFLSRLVPFISFDAVSYAAGLTPLSFWRFILATFAGVVPISFLLTFFGERLLMMESHWSVIGTVVVAVITLLPLAFKRTRQALHK
jgi:uncharacterized membrane protein YdjX (TVP38/TMEM64 family)